MKHAPLVLIIAFTLANAAPPVNILDNGDFSKPVTAKFVDGVVVPGWESVTPNVVVPDGAEHVMRLGRSNNNLAAFHQPVAVPPGKKQIKCTLRVRSSDGADAKYEVTLQALDANRKGLSARGVVSGLAEKLAIRTDTLKGKSWKTVRFQKVLPANAEFFVLVLASAGEGSVDFADVVCTAE